jgi:hypothetical protein
MTLKDAYELHIESDRFSNIVKDNLKEDLEFLTDGGLSVAIRDLEEIYMEISSKIKILNT